MASVLFKIPRGLQGYTIIDLAIIGRFVALSKKGTSKIFYSTKDAKKDGFTSDFKNHISKLSELLTVEKSYGGCRVITLNSGALQMESCLFILVPKEVMALSSLSFSDKIIFGRIFTQTKQGKEKIKLTTSMLSNEFFVSAKTIQRSLTSLKEQDLITTENVYNGSINERYVSVNMNILQGLSSNSEGQIVPNNIQDMSSQYSEFDPHNIQNLTLSSSLLSEHILSEHILSECKKGKSEVITKKSEYPNSAKECEVYFYEYIQKYLHTNPALQMMNVPFVASEFFEYWSGNDWKDSKGKKVKSIKGRVATWIGNNIYKLEREYKKQNALARLHTYEELHGDTPNFLGNNESLLDFTDNDNTKEEIKDDLPF